MWVRLTNLTALGCLFLASAAAAETQQKSGEQSIDFEQAIAKTLVSNPALVAFGHQVDAQRGRLANAGMRPAVELGIEVENVSGTGVFSGVDRAEATFSLAWVLERGKRERRMDVARSGLSLVESEREMKRLEAAAETARLFLLSLAYQAQLDIAEEAVTLATDTVAAVQKRVSAGRTPKAELARAEVELSRARLEREDWEHRLRTSLRTLTAQWGESGPGIERVEGALAKLPELRSFTVLLASIDQNPMLQRYLSEKRLRQAELRHVEAGSKPDWRLTVGIRQLQQTDEQAIVAGIRIPLGAGKRNAGRIATATADLARSEAERAASRVELEARLFALYEELNHSLHRALTLRDDILPRLEGVLSETLQAYQAGRYSYFELRAAQNDALRARTEAMDALIDAHLNVVRIETLTGMAVTSPTWEQ